MGQGHSLPGMVAGPSQDPSLFLANGADGDWHTNGVLTDHDK